MLWSVLAYIDHLQSSVVYLVPEADACTPDFKLREGVLEAVIWSPSLPDLLLLHLYSVNAWFLLLH